MKKIITIAIAVIMLFAVSVTVSAENAEIGFDSSYDAETGLVAVTIYINNAVGLQSADFSLGFDTGMYEFEDYETSDIDKGMIVAGYVESTPGLCSCSVIFTDKCVESDLDNNGRLALATYTFKPVNDEYDLNEFCLWASSFDVNDVSVLKSIKAQGNAILQEEKTDSVTLRQDSANNTTAETTKKGTQSATGDITSKWYVYVIAGVLAVGAIAGIAFVAIKNGQNESEEKSEKDSENSEN